MWTGIWQTGRHWGPVPGCPPQPPPLPPQPASLSQTESSTKRYRESWTWREIFVKIKDVTLLLFEEKNYMFLVQASKFTRLLKDNSSIRNFYESNIGSVINIFFVSTLPTFFLFYITPNQLSKEIKRSFPQILYFFFYSAYIYIYLLCLLNCFTL